MNVVLLCDKKYIKPFKTAVKKDPNINLIGIEPILKGNTMSRIADHHNPHVLVVYDDVTKKEGITVSDCISFLRMRKPNMRIIYVYGKVEKINEFTLLSEQLINNGITDIVTDTDAEKVINVIDEPMSEDDVHVLIDKLKAPDEEIPHEELSCSETVTKQSYESLAIDFPTVSAHDNFDIDNIVYEVSEINESERLKIGISQLQHHIGCTHTAFEFAAMLSKAKKVAIIMADTDTFEALAVFHHINPINAKRGLLMNGIAVFPYEMRNQIANEYSIIIYDFSFLKDEKRKAFDECDIKLMLASAAEWDIAKVVNFIKFNEEEYARSITFFFPRVTQSKFLKYSKALKRSGINAYRLLDSPNWTSPVEGNLADYTHIIENYIITKNAKKAKRPKRKLIRVKKVHRLLKLRA